jgi:heme exporter protein D
MNFANWHDFLYMGGHYLYVWLSYGIGITGIVVTLVRPIRARRRFFSQQQQRARREGLIEADASRSS